MSDTTDSLEKWVIEYQASGQAWVLAKLKSDQLTEGQKNFLSALINKIEGEWTDKVSEAKLERLARGSKEFVDYTNSMCLAVNKTLSLRVRYDALNLLFEAERSKMSFAKEQFKFLPHTP